MNHKDFYFGLCLEKPDGKISKEMQNILFLGLFCQNDFSSKFWLSQFLGIYIKKIIAQKIRPIDWQIFLLFVITVIMLHVGG